MNKISDKDLAIEIVWRLNTLINSSQDTAKDIKNLLSLRVPVSDDTLNNPTIQCAKQEKDEKYSMSFLGLLNGLIGVKDKDGVCSCGWVYSVECNELCECENKINIMFGVYDK